MKDKTIFILLSCIFIGNHTNASALCYGIKIWTGDTVDVVIALSDTVSQTSYELEDVIVCGQLAKVRKTPVASSFVSSERISYKLGNNELVSVLKSTPGVHPNDQGGGWGDSEIFMRGFDNSDIAVMVNGIPVNDMETGLLYWSNWAELADVAKSIQTQRGFGANTISAPSVGGVINIVTNGIQNKAGGDVSYSVGSNGYNKVTLSFNTGYTPKGWSFSFAGSKTWGNGNAVGLDFSTYSYFVNISYRINLRHQLSFLAFGSPQQHYMRSNALTSSEWDNVKKYDDFGKDWSYYNPDYGFDGNGTRKSSDFNKYHKPFFSLSHIWEIDYKSSLSTTAYASIGYGYSYSGIANSDEYSEYDWYGASEGKLNTKFRKADGTFDYACIEQINEASDHGSEMAMSNMKTNFQWYGFVSDYKNEFYDCLNLNVGIDFRFYKGTHTNVISDLYCGEYFIDPSRSAVKSANNAQAENDNWQTEKLYVGDVVNRDYDCYIIQGGTFAQLEYSKNNLTAFIAGALNCNAVWRYDRFYYDGNHARSKTKGLVGGSVKTGVNYNINEHNNVFANIGFISKVPQVKNGVFMSINTSNLINNDALNEKVVSAELGYGLHYSFIDLKANVYWIEWMDKTMAKSGTLEDGSQYYMNMTGVSARHIGFELEVMFTPVKWMQIGAMVSIGDWKWNNDSIKGLAYNSYGQAITPEGEVTTPGAADQAWAMINMKGVKVGGSAQTTAAFELAFIPLKRLRLSAEYNLYDRNYAYYSLSGKKLKLGQVLNVSDAWRIPLAGNLDLNASYSFSIKKVDITISGQVDNVIGQRNIEKAWNPANISQEKSEVNAEDVYMFYSKGRTWSVSLKVGI